LRACETSTTVLHFTFEPSLPPLTR